MEKCINTTADRVIPQLPPAGNRLRVVIDTDFANEVDDMYAVALVLTSPERFCIEGFVATHFNNSGKGPQSIESSFQLLNTFLKVSGADGKYPVLKGAHPMAYYGYPSEGEGVDFIIQRARAGSEEDPLWVVGLGAATNLASAILKAPDIIPKVRYVFHARSDQTWPQRSVQFNVLGDIHAARALLKSQVPLVWFDTGSQIRCDPAWDGEHIAPIGAMGQFMHDYRMAHPWLECRTAAKGFYDLGDIAWMLDPDCCTGEIVNAPTMDPYMFFDHAQPNGQMLRIYDVNNEKVWQLLVRQMRQYYSC